MSRGADLLRVVKGARKVVQAVFEENAFRATATASRLREHGVGVSSSLKDAASSMTRPSQERDGGSGDFSAVAKSSNPATQQRHADGDGSRDVYSEKVASEGMSQRSTEELTPAPSNDLADVPTRATTSSGEKQADSFDNRAPVTDHEVKVQEGTTVIASTTSNSADINNMQLEKDNDVSTSKLPWDDSSPWTFGDDSSGTGSAPREPSSPLQAVSSGGEFRSGMRNSRTRTVPSSPLARVFGFGQLAAGLAMGTVAEAVRQNVGGSGTGNGSEKQGKKVKQYIVSDANAERLAETLCRMRGAALKLGQMLSIQDESVVPPSLAKALDRVRQGADVMPEKQLHRQLEKSLGADWRHKVAAFDENPLAAASIGQVHRARLLDGTEVVMKIQYPGVADSVESDLKNLQRLVELTNILPPGLFIEEIIDVAREELGEECDYEKEAANQDRFRELVSSDPKLNKWASVPRVVPSLSSKEVLTTHLAKGVPVDHVLPMPQEVRNHVARLMLRCTINELFAWRFMQTDPNWGNFLFDRQTGKMSLIDFGACREYRKDFVDDYLRLVWSAANRDEAEIMRVSKELKFLTGDETAAMMKAHVQAGLVVGEPFVDRGDEPFDFHGSNITTRLSQHGDTFMKHRLTPPPREAYSLHRKLAGAFLMNIKLKAVIPCRDILQEVHSKYEYN